jgi:DNA modification methylase
MPKPSARTARPKPSASKNASNPELAAEWCKLQRLKLWKENPRDNDGEPVERVMRSIQRFGWGAPILARKADGEIIAGHARFKAAQALKLQRVPVRFLDISKREAHLLALADNRIAELTQWSDSLGAVLADFELPEMDLAGWSQADMDKMAADLLRSEGALEDDEVPELPKHPVTALGDVWTLGRHRLVCGDSTNAEAVALALRGAAPLIMVTDPPYGVEYEPDWRKERGVNNSDGRSVVTNDDRADWVAAYRLFPGPIVYVWHGDLFAVKVGQDIQECGFVIRSQLVWKKPQIIVSRGHYHFQHEACWYAVRDGASAKWVGGHKQSSVWEIASRDASDVTIHCAQKPIECMARPIRNHGGAGDHVYDPFMGSGTALVAAEQLDRTCDGLELNPAYCDVTVERWQKLTGGKAVRASR